mmetsp:Transcript_47330/g.112570  ORF Transcript_47330/g.112570 Transcript_47330/m.112570 type:complete len:103 (+) Transcript_47330:105-413(+)|eukprot:CAMPEP_0178410746 /NCGR_PEP_ID=MMETSP0689_2-20121128/21143_1 /TAXON_ID=160604 /ORGANISM="Amphidinium massartii, Strain CS-259" /LENGTH=102 /DNA_ID=CAMNT_0020031941 /DNA_START=103 /DNA_END=411 /DNA_ORIENTATION=-
MARSRSVLSAVALLALAAYLSVPAFVSPAASSSQRVVAPAAALGGLALPLAVATPAFAYDSVVSFLQAWLFGGTFMILLLFLVLTASIANPLTIRREEADRA